jgi:hypothetical protein
MVAANSRVTTSGADMFSARIENHLPEAVGGDAVRARDLSLHIGEGHSVVAETPAAVIHVTAVPLFGHADLGISLVVLHQYKDGREDPPSSDVFTVPVVCVPSLPPQANVRNTAGRPPPRNVSPAPKLCFR